MLEFRPNGFASIIVRRIRRSKQCNWGQQIDIFTAFLSAANLALLIILNRYKGTFLTLRILIDERQAMFDQQRHDQLLFDDEHFPSSKVYFWAIKMMKDLESNLKNNMSQIQRLMDFEPPYRVKEAFKVELEKARSETKELYDAYSDNRERCRDICQQTIVLRDEASFTFYPPPPIGCLHQFVSNELAFFLVIQR